MSSLDDQLTEYRELDEGRVAEWQSQYFDYKQGKKKIKAVTKALKNATGRQWRTPRQVPQRPASQNGLTAFATPIAISRPNPEPANDGRVRVGSIVGSPPSDESEGTPTPSRPASLNLGDPAIDMAEAENNAQSSGVEAARAAPHRSPASDTDAQTRASNNAYEIGKTKHPSPFKSSLRRALSSPLHHSQAHTPTERQLFRQILSRSSSAKFSKSPIDIPLEAQREVDARKDEFWTFLNGQLEKIESFYRLKEEEATARLDALKTQLHLLRDHRLLDLELHDHPHRKPSKAVSTKNENDGANERSSEEPSAIAEGPHGLKALYNSMHAARHVHFHKPKEPHQSGATNLMTPPGPQAPAARMDHERKPMPTHLSYNHAKRKLRAALQEFYRGLELLKSYTLLNRTAFRKINKKWDKAIRMRPYMAFMAKVNDAHFVQSDVLDNQLHQIEDLYTRYFERGNRKVAVAKLRRRGLQSDTYHRSSFWDGLSIAGGLVFGIQGLVYAVEILFEAPDGSKQLNDTSYLLQVSQVLPDPTLRC